MIGLIAIGLGTVLLLVQPVTAQTPAGATTEGAFDRLSPGNQKIARALHDAQPAPPAASGSTAPAPLTLDEIAARKLDGQGWGNVFKDMKAEGLVQEKNLGQVVSRYSRRHGGAAPPSGTLITTASGRTRVVGGRDGVGRRGPGLAGDDDAERGVRGAGHERSASGARDHSAGHQGASGSAWRGGGEGSRHGSLATTGGGSSNGGSGRAGSPGHAGGRGK